MGNVVFIACTNVGRALIEAVRNRKALQDVRLSGVVNLSPKAAVGKANYDSYLDLAQKYGLPVYYCENVNENGCISFLKNCRPDIIIQSGWSQKFKQELLEIPAYACIGEHPAPLPKGRGAACVNWAILNGESQWGDTFFKMEMQYDTGLIYAQESFRIELYDDVKTVYDKVAKAAVSILEQHLPDWVEGKLDGKKQDDSKATHYPRRKPSDGEFDFQRPALEIYNHIRAQAAPYPGAFFYLDDPKGERKKVYVWKAALGDGPVSGGRAVTCADGNTVTLLRVQIGDGPQEWAADCLSDSDLPKNSCEE